MVGAQGIEGAISPRRKLQELTAQRVRYHHILQHPNIVSAYSMEEIPEMGPCIIMEWIDGITLDNWNGTKTEGESIFLQLLDAVHYIHAKQIVHRD